MATSTSPFRAHAAPNVSRPYTSSNLSQHSRSGSLRDTAYNGSEGLINDTSSAVQFDGSELQERQLAASVRSDSATRPALGARLLSSISNAQPAAAALSRKGSLLHSRARSLAAYVPKLNAADTTSTSEKPHVPNKIFGDLFHGESAPIRLGPPVSPTKEKEESEFVMEYSPSFTERPVGAYKRRDTATSITSTPPAQTRKTSSWFGRNKALPTPPKQQSQDELTTMNINHALFPNGPADALNPAAFNDLLLNATNLLQRMQAAYKEKVDFISTIQPEIDAQREEVEEADTRSKHLKFQMESLSQQVADQKQTMQEMAESLAAEKIKTQEAREAAEAARTVRMVRSDDEDDDTPTRRRKRTSDGSASDSGFESDMDSVFSANSGAETPISPPYVNGRDWRQPRQMHVETLQKRPNGGMNNAGKRIGGDGAAWATVEALRNENYDLKVQMEEMQTTLQGCIELVSGINGPS